MYVELVLEVAQRYVNHVSDALLDAGALAASIEDADAGTAAEVAMYDEPGEDGASAWPVSRIIALFDANTDIAAALAAIEVGSNAPPWRVLDKRDVAPADWVRLTQAQFEPIAIGNRLWIVPSWHELPAGLTADAVCIRLDPGLAFGTGTHPTTRLCLRWLEANVQQDDSVIDFGCGSGILAIAASKLGAARVIGTDIDAQAISASLANARDNQCPIEFVESSQFKSPPAGIVIANILSNPLKLLAPMLAALARPGGALVLSGILARQADDLIEIYRPWIGLSVWDVDEGWVCLAGRVAPAAKAIP